MATGELEIRFFAGIALRLPCGKPIGMLCMMHSMPRRFARKQRQLLVDLGQMIEHEVGLGKLDSSDRLQVRQAIDRFQAQHALYVETFHRTPVAIAHIGSDWEWRHMNDACVKFFAHSRAPLTKTNILDLLDANDRTRLEQAVQALNRGRAGEVLTLDVTFRLRNKQRKPTRVQVARKQTTSARDGGWLFVIHDTRAERQEKAARDAREAALHRGAHEASEGLRREHEQLTSTERQLGATRVDLHAIANNLPVLVAYVDGERRYRFANSTYREWLGVDPEEIVGRLAHEVLAADYVAAIEPYVQRVLNGERVEYEVGATANGVRSRFGPFRTLSVLAAVPNVADRTHRSYQLPVVELPRKLSNISSRSLPQNSRSLAKNEGAPNTPRAIASSVFFSTDSLYREEIAAAASSGAFRPTGSPMVSSVDRSLMSRLSDQYARMVALTNSYALPCSAA